MGIFSGWSGKSSPTGGEPNQAMLDQINALRTELNQLKGTQGNVYSQMSFVTSQEQLEGITENPEKFNTFLQQFAEKVSTTTRDSVMAEVPQITDSQIVARQKFANMVAKSPELEQYAGFMETTAEQIYTANPNIGIDQLITEVEQRTRATYAEPLREQGDKGNNGAGDEGDPNAGGFAGGAGAQGGASGGSGDEGKTDFQQQVGSMFEAFGFEQGVK